MRKIIIAASAALLSLGVTAQAGEQAGSKYPLLSGTYLFQSTTICQPTLSVTNNGQGQITSVTLVPANDASSTTTGKFTATQGTPKGTGSISLSATSGSGDPIVVTGANGESGTSLGVGTGSETVTFKQTATTFSLTDSNGTSTYNIYYGTATGKDVGTAVFSGLDYKGCAESGSVSLVQ